MRVLDGALWQGKTNHGDVWESSEVRFHVGSSQHQSPCTNIELAAVHGCVSGGRLASTSESVSPCGPITCIQYVLM